MALIVAEFFGLIGLDMSIPYNLGELIPYILTFLVGVALVSGVFRVVGKLADFIIDFTRW